MIGTGNIRMKSAICAEVSCIGCDCVLAEYYDIVAPAVGRAFVKHLCEKGWIQLEGHLTIIDLWMCPDCVKKDKVDGL